MSDIREQLAALTPEQRRQFAQRLRQQQPPARPTSQHIPRRTEPANAPLSFAQQRMWLLDQLEPGNPLYTMTPTMRLNGPLDVAALEYALNQIVCRHETLRATFPAHEGQPVQIIAPHLTIPLPVADLRDRPPAERESAAQQMIDAEVQHHMNLASGPLFRARVLRLADDDHILVVTMHHIISDGWSLAVLIKELVALYVAYTTNTPSPLPELPIQYADYAAWQRQRLHGAFLDRQLAHWRAHLADVPVLQLPTDHPHPAVQSYRSANLLLSFSPSLTGALKQLSRRTSTTLFMTVFATFAALLSRLSDQRDFCIGSLVAGRNQPELEGLIGFFINNLALRVDLRGRPSAEALLRQVRATTLASYDHQDVPFEVVLEALNPTRNASHTPLFQVMCVMQNFPRPHEVLPGLVLRPLYTASRRSGFELTLWLWEEQESLAGELEYNPTLFEPPTIKRIASQLRTLLTQFAAEPSRPISALALLSAAERQQLLLDWNATTTPYPSHTSLHELIAEQAERRPDAVALVDEGRTTNDERSTSSFVVRPSSLVHLTYAALDARANQLAHHLRALGVGPDVPIAVSMERSVELPLALLGVLKAGGAYVPLDPSYPAERITFMLEDSGATVLITTNDERRMMNDEAPAFVLRPSSFVNLAADWPLISHQPDDAPASGVCADNLAYIIYTSGSTGTPKGAMNSHRGILNRLLWMQQTYQLAEDDCVLHKTPFSFDVSVWELFWPLISGARQVVARPGGQQDSAYLARLIARQRISTLHFVPSMLQVFLDEPELAGCATLRRVICSGEALSVELQQRYFARLSAALHNLYGPTEAAIDVSVWACAPDQALHSVPIGRPIANTQLYLLDRALEPVPIGVAGELYIGGVQLARGYLNRPDLTAERFVPNPFVTTNDERRTTNDEVSDSSFVLRHSSRLYRTGDLARYRADGAIEFVGRIDGQVKLRGFRIELGEVEAALARHPAVRECAVLLREANPADQRLVAYVVPTDDERPTTNDESIDASLIVGPSSFVTELRSFLKERLPEYMVPSAFVELDALPLTPSGKLDRRALPAPHISQDAARAYVAPRTEVEELLAQLWSELLGLAQVGVTDRFFDLGGHSLLVAQMLFRLRETFQVELPLRALFESTTIAELALTIEEQLLAEIEALSEEEAEHLTI